MKRFLFVAVLAVFTAACGSVNVVQSRTLSLTFKAGDTYHYTLHSTTKQTIAAGMMTIPVDVDVSADEAVNVKSVDAAGTADLAVTMTKLTIKTVTADGVTNTTTIPSQTSEVQIASDGRPVSWNGAQVTSGNPFEAFAGLGGSLFISAVLPAGKVKPGDTWSKSYDRTSPDGTGTVHITSNSKYLRNESLKGVNAAVVETKSTGTFSLSMDASKLGGETSGTPMPVGAIAGMTVTGTITTDVTSWIDPDGHRVLKTHSTATDNGTMNIQASPPAQAMPGLAGPITVQGTATTDLNPV